MHWDLCKAFELIAGKYPDFRLIMVGRQNGFEAEKVLQRIAQSQFKDRFVCLPLVSEQTLRDLYAKAKKPLMRTQTFFQIKKYQT